MVNPDMKEQRSPSMANYFQRRLAMKTPFPGEPEQSSEAEYIKSRKITLRAVDSSVINFTAAYFASTSAKETAAAQGCTLGPFSSDAKCGIPGRTYQVTPVTFVPAGCVG